MQLIVPPAAKNASQLEHGISDKTGEKQRERERGIKGNGVIAAVFYLSPKNECQTLSQAQTLI